MAHSPAHARTAPLERGHELSTLLRGVWGASGLIRAGDSARSRDVAAPAQRCLKRFPAGVPAGLEGCRAGRPEAGLACRRPGRH